MIIILQHEAAARTNCQNHLPHDSEWVAYVFENEARVGQIEIAPLGRRQRQMGRFPLPEFNQQRFTCLIRKRPGFRKLMNIPLDSKYLRPGPCGPRHSSRQLTQPGAEVKNGGSGWNRQFPQGRVIHELIQL